MERTARLLFGFPIIGALSAQQVLFTQDFEAHGPSKRLCRATKR